MAALNPATKRVIARPVVWAGVSILVAAIVVEVTRTGVDILALLVGGFLLLVIERTLGDWIADSLGPLPTVLIFIAIASLAVTYATAEGGRSRLRRVFTAADEHGYHTLYFSLDDDTSGEAAGSVNLSAGGSGPRTPSTGAPPVSASRPPARQPVGSAPAVASAPAASPVSSSAGTPTSTPSVSAVSNPAPEAHSSNASPPAPRQAGNVRIQRLRVLPEVGVVGESLVFRADVSSDGAGALPAVEFSVDGHTIAVVKPDERGVASARWKTRVPGQYVVRAGLAGALFGAQRASAVLSVLPGRD
jgi:hypothetical protein